MPEGYKYLGNNGRSHVGMATRAPSDATIKLWLLDVPPSLRGYTSAGHAGRFTAHMSDVDKTYQGITALQDGSAQIVWRNNRGQRVGKSIFRSCAKDGSLLCLCVGKWSPVEDNRDPNSALSELNLENVCASMTPR